MSPKKYYDEEIKVFHKRYVDQLASIPSQSGLPGYENLPTPEQAAIMGEVEFIQRFDVATAEYVQIYAAEYSNNEKAARKRKDLPDC